MTSRDFCYWLQGSLEINDNQELNANQIGVIKKHLNMVFLHEIDPSMGDEKKQAILNGIHNPPNGGSGVPNKEITMRC